MIKLWLVLGLVTLQEPSPQEHHSWLRFKPGTWIKNKVTVQVSDSIRVSHQKLTFKDKSAKDYGVEEIETIDDNDKAPVVRRTSFSTIIGKETLKFDQKEYPCSISLEKTQNPDGESEMKYWMPPGHKYPLKVVIKQPGFAGEVVAVAIDEKVKVCGREYLCAKLQRKVKMGDVDATLTAWLSQEIPGSQARLTLTLNTPGNFEMHVSPVELHEEK